MPNLYDQLTYELSPDPFGIELRTKYNSVMGCIFRTRQSRTRHYEFSSAPCSWLNGHANVFRMCVSTSSRSDGVYVPSESVSARLATISKCATHAGAITRATLNPRTLLMSLASRFLSTILKNTSNVRRRKSFKFGI